MADVCLKECEMVGATLDFCSRGKESCSKCTGKTNPCSTEPQYKPHHHFVSTFDLQITSIHASGNNSPCALVTSYPTFVNQAASPYYALSQLPWTDGAPYLSLWQQQPFCSGDKVPNVRKPSRFALQCALSVDFDRRSPVFSSERL
jgi:hypothetical protein